MKICNLFIVLLLTVTSVQLFSQPELDSLVKIGITYHDNGEYDQAIATYNKALELNAESALVNYELALSYFKKGDYQEAIDYSDIILEQKKELLLEAYMTKGSSLDLLGKTSESIQLFENAIKEAGGHYLLYYNLALNYYKLDNIGLAEDNAMNAIAANTNHSSSHYMLASIHDQKGNSVQSLLAIYYFLFLEPNSSRSPDAMKMLNDNFGRHVSKDETQPNTTNIQLFEGEDDFSAVNLMISLLKASESTEENEGKSEEELFVEHTKVFFEVLGEPKDKDNDEIWWAFYQPFYSALADSEHLTTYCKYITQQTYPNSIKWIDENPDKLAAFGEWLKLN